MRATVNFILLSFFVMTALVSPAQIPNAGFETWNSTGFPSYLNPQGWGTLNGSTWLGGIGAVTCERGSGADVYGGTYSMKLTSKSILGLGDAPGITVTGTINTSTQEFEGGFTYTQRPEFLTGWFKYAPAAGDTGEITIWLWRRNAGVYELVGEGQFRPTGATSTFTRFMIPITYSSGNAPDSARIAMISTNTDNIQLNSTLIVDEIAFVSCSSLSVTTVATDESAQGANDGAVDATVTGGTGPYTYAWSNSANTEDINGLPSGNYCVTVTDANGCTVSSCALVSSPSCTGFSVNVTDTDISIVGGSDGIVYATPSGGTAPYSYSWNTPDTVNLAAGTYCVTVTDAASCIATGCVDVTEPDCSGFSVNATATDASSGTATDGSVAATPSGGVAPYMYSWDNFASDSTVSNLAPSIYCVTVSDGVGCSADDCVAIGPDCTDFGVNIMIADASGGLNNGAATANTFGGTAPFTYAWSTGSNAQAITDLAPDEYCVSVTDANGCEGNVCDSVDMIGSIGSLAEAGIQIYPNPAYDVVTVELKTQEAFNFRLYDVAGKLVSTEMLSSKNTAISLRELPSGNYIIELQQTSTGNMFSGKLRKK